MPNEAKEYRLAETGPDKVHHTFDAPSLLTFRKARPIITPNVIVKTAFALLNMAETKHPTALFGNLEASRAEFPFLPDGLSKEAIDVSDPTMQAVINLIRIQENEIVSSLLQRMQQDQLDLTLHAAAPIKDLISSLGKDGKMIPEILGHGHFNWVPGLGAIEYGYEQLQVLYAVCRPRQGISSTLR